MKSKLLFLAMLLLGITPATATTTGDVVFNGEDFNNVRYRFTEPITFVERGVEFLIFPDGSFDFNTEAFSTNPNNDNYYYRRNRRGTNRTYGAPGIRYQHNNRGVLIRHDRQGRVRRIGNVFINYDRQGRIKRAGSVYMNYNRRAQLRQVGGLRILYNRYGDIIGTRGFVNFNNQNNSPYNGNGCLGDNNSYNQWDNDLYDDDFYYYRNKGTAKKQKKSKS